MKKKKIIPAILAGVALLSINSSVKATDYYELKNVQQMLSDDGKQMSIEYRPKSLSSSGTKFLSNVFQDLQKIMLEFLCHLHIFQHLKVI